MANHNDNVRSKKADIKIAKFLKEMFDSRETTLDAYAVAYNHGVDHKHVATCVRKGILKRVAKRHYCWDTDTMPNIHMANAVRKETVEHTKGYNKRTPEIKNQKSNEVKQPESGSGVSSIEALHKIIEDRFKNVQAQNVLNREEMERLLLLNRTTTMEMINRFTASTVKSLQKTMSDAFISLDERIHELTKDHYANTSDIKTSISKAKEELLEKLNQQPPNDSTKEIVSAILSPKSDSNSESDTPASSNNSWFEISFLWGLFRISKQGSRSSNFSNLKPPKKH